MRVISGTLKGRKLSAPKGRVLRPTSDRVREAIFDILQYQIEGRRVLDLFAGTGALGIEALSRGAERAVFVEGNAQFVAVLKKNLDDFGLQERAEVVHRQVRTGIKALAGRGEEFDLVFLDPPYDKDLARQTLQFLSEEKILSPEGLIVAEHSREESLDGIVLLEQIDQRRYGRTLVSFFRRTVITDTVSHRGTGNAERE